MQSRVVAVRLDVGDVGAADEAGDAAALDRDLLVAVADRVSAALDHPAYGLRQPVLAHRLEHVVDGVQVERLDGVLLVSGHEHDRRRLAEPGQHLGQVEAREPRHLDVEEDRVDVEVLEDPERVGGRVGGEDTADPRVALEQERQLVERRALVVDDEHAQQATVGGHGVGPHWACTPGANLGTRTTTLVPAPGAVSTTRP